MSEQQGFDPNEYQADAPPTESGDFVPVKPPEGWPTVIGILAIIFGALGIIGGVCNTAMVFLQPVMQNASATAGGPPTAQMSTPYPAAQAALQLVEMAIAVVLLVGGIMLLRRSAKAAGVLMAYAGLDLLANTAGAVVGYFVMGAMIEQMKNDPQTQQAPPFVLQLMQSMGVGFVVIGWLFAAIWPVFLLLWFRRAKIRETMAGWG